MKPVSIFSAALHGVLITTSLLFAESVEIKAVLETRAMLNDFERQNNDCDDPAIWIHPLNRSKSLIITKDGFWRPVIHSSIDKFLKYGDLKDVLSASLLLRKVFRLSAVL